MEIWPEGLAHKETEGFSDEELELLCSERCGRREMHPVFQAPWMFFSTEVYGHGRAIREVTGWPFYLPIPVASDHGLTHAIRLHRHEEMNPSRVHVTFSAWRAKTEGSKKVLRLTHPWVLFRKEKGYSKLPSAKGTLLFIDHSYGNLKEERPLSWRQLMSLYDDMAPELRPRAIMLHSNDIRKHLHLQLRDLGVPIFTAGNGQSPFFVERFYSVLRHFNFATSSTLGTQTFIAQEMGVHYFLIGRPLRHTGPASDNEGVVQEWLDTTTKASEGATIFNAHNELFRSHPTANYAERKRAVSEALDDTQDSLVQRRRYRKLMLAEFFPSLFRVTKKMFRLLVVERRLADVTRWLTHR